jgi:hypothetical protein
MPEGTSTSMIEGPAGLLALRWLGACGTPNELRGMWLSKDTLTWQTLPMTPFQGAVVLSVSGGSAGYLATGYVGQAGKSTPAAWTSRNATTWKRVDLAGSSFANSTISDGTVFDAGFILVGASWPKVLPDCPSPMTATAWWSADGTAWSKAPLPGGTAAYQVWRLGDGEVLVAGSSGTRAMDWVSTDGRTWTSVQLSVDSCDGFCPPNIGAVGDRGFVIGYTRDTGSETVTTHATEAYSIEGTSVRKIESSGEIPINSYRIAFGPAGIFTVGLYGQAWLGVPKGFEG